MKKDLYATVTNKILTQLQTGAVPWVKPWGTMPAGNGIACNADTGRPYNGVNIILIWSAMAVNPAWAAPRFLTFKQCQALGGHVKKGEHGTQICFVKPLIVKDGKAAPTIDGTEVTRTVTMLREFTVFNIAQCDGLPARCMGVPSTIKPRNKGERDETIDAFLQTIGATIRHGGDRAFYASGEHRDWIQLPEFAAFKSPDHYYATSFHEHGHWTGAKSRLDREFGKRFGDKAYAAEELVAELTAAFLCAEFSIDGDLRHADYIATWIDLLKHDSKAFFTAASKAQAAADYLRGLALADSVKEAA